MQPFPMPQQKRPRQGIVTKITKKDMRQINPFDLSKNTKSQLLEYYFRLTEERKRIERGQIMADDTFEEKVRTINNFTSKIEEVADFLKANY